MKNILITDKKLKLPDTTSFNEKDRTGGLVYFVGTVRNHSHEKNVQYLEFECYPTMAEKEIKKIIDYCIQKWQLKDMVVHHRIGKVLISEIAVIIVATAPHRKSAFEACEYAIDTLKETVPIWKKEFYDNGSYWVSSHP